jgi:hypothetical protein
MRNFTDDLRTFFKFVVRNRISFLENACITRIVLVGHRLPYSRKSSVNGGVPKLRPEYGTRCYGTRRTNWAPCIKSFPIQDASLRAMQVNNGFGKAMPKESTRAARKTAEDVC